MNRTAKWDLVLAGGGAAGSGVAPLVAMQGHRVLLLERERHPRHQIGESLLPATILGMCRLLGASGDGFHWRERPAPAKRAKRGRRV